MPRNTGRGGSYRVNGREFVPEQQPTAPTDTGGARTSDGKPIEDAATRIAQAPVSALPAPVEAEAEAAATKKKGA